MGIHIRISLYSKKVAKVVTRYLHTAKQARDYLANYKIPSDQEGTHFQVGADSFALSHPYEDILHHDHLEDNPMSLAFKPIGRAIEMPRNTYVEKPGTESSKSPTDNPSPKPARAAPTGAVICLKNICREINMEPRQARAILRKKFPDNGKQRWEWDKSGAEEIKKVLTSAS